MNKSSKGRRDVAIAVVIIIGLVIGFLIKRVHVGLLIGVGMGLLAGGLLSNRK